MRPSTFVVCVGVAVSVSSVATADNRTIDGSGNNLSSPLMGAAGTNLSRGSSGCHYEDGIGVPMARPNARMISNMVSSQTTGGLGNARNLSSMVWQWGQFIDHDFALVDESTESMPIVIPAGDPVFDPTNTGTAMMPFTRSVYSGGTSPSTPREHANALTHWIDGSMVYGSDSARANGLRAMSGGRLAMSAGDLLPYNTGGLPNAMGTSPSFFVAGDIRANEQTGLLAMHTLFVREHNRVADQIAATNPSLSDEQIYQKARKIVGAEVQAITYNEWLPALLGGTSLPAYSGYNSTVDARINTVFSTAAFRIGHTMLNDQLLRVNADGTTFSGGHLNLFQQFFNPSSITGPGALDAVLRGLGRQQANEVDTQTIDGVRNLLFGGTNGRDLIALNLQRGRDHGIPDFNTVRSEYGLPVYTSFSQITSDAVLAAQLSSAYGGDINNVDAWIGLFAEDHLPGSSLGETVRAIFLDQFMRLRDGDRYFYLNDTDLTGADLSFLNDLTLADIIRLNTGAGDVQDAIFFAVPAPASAVLLTLGGLMAYRRRRT